MKKKSKLQKRRDDPNSTLWKRKADRLWSKLVALNYNSKCDICGSAEYVQAHHLIPREMYSHRHIVENGIALCCTHHKYSFQLSAHRGAAEFFKWLIQNRRNKWEWLLVQSPSKEMGRSFKDVAYDLEAALNPALRSGLEDARKRKLNQGPDLDAAKKLSDQID